MRISDWSSDVCSSDLPDAAAARSGDRRLRDRGLRQLFYFGFAQHVAAAPDGLDVIVAVARHAQLLAELADEDVDDLEFGLVHPAVEVVEEHFLGERGALAQAQQLEHRIFLARQMDARAIDLDRLGIEIDRELAGLDDRLAVPLRTADDGVDARQD